MKTKTAVIKKMISVAVVSLLLATLFAQGAFTTVIKKTVSEMIQEADYILIGKVVEMQSKRVKELIYTDVVIDLVEAPIKGPKEKRIVVRIPGGVVKELGLWVEDAPKFRIGEETLVFLKKSEEFPQILTTVGWAQGKLVIEKGQIRIFATTIPVELGIRIIEKGMKRPKMLNALEDRLNVIYYMYEKREIIMVEEKAPKEEILRLREETRETMMKEIERFLRDP